MVPSLEERRRRFRHLAETHPGLVVASALVAGVSADARAERRIALCAGMGVGGLRPKARIRPNCNFPFGHAPNAMLGLAVDSALAGHAPFCHHGRRAMAPKELLPLIQQLKDWRHANGFSQSKAVRALNEAGIPVTLYSLQSWEIGRWNPRAPVALALAEFLQKQPKRRRRKRSNERGQ